VQATPASGIGIESARELSLLAGRLVCERQGKVIMGDRVGQPLGVFLRLRFDAGQGVPLGLGLDDPDDLSISVQEVVRRTGLERELAHRDAKPRGDVHGLGVLNDPAALPQLLVDLLSSFLFWCHGSLGLEFPILYTLLQRKCDLRLSPCTTSRIPIYSRSSVIRRPWAGLPIPFEVTWPTRNNLNKAG